MSFQSALSKTHNVSSVLIAIKRNCTGTQRILPAGKKNELISLKNVWLRPHRTQHPFIDSPNWHQAVVWACISLLANASYFYLWSPVDLDSATNTYRFQLWKIIQAGEKNANLRQFNSLAGNGRRSKPLSRRSTL